MFGGDFGLALDALGGLAVVGVTIGIVLAVVVGAAKLGWQFAPWIFGLALLWWYFGG